jgi:hypothetical protein
VIATLSTLNEGLILVGSKSFIYIYKLTIISSREKILPIFVEDKCTPQQELFCVWS